MSTRKCHTCGNEARIGKVHCQRCMDKMVAKARASRASGYCIDCHKVKPDGGKSRCTSCTKKRRDYDKRVRDARLVAGLCAECGKQHNEKTKLCARCKAKSLARVNKSNFGGMRDVVVKRDNGICQCCGEPGNLVHHIDNTGPDTQFHGGRISNKTNNDPGNLLLMCRRCHSDIHRLNNKDTRHLATSLVIHPGVQNNTRDRATTKGWIPARKQILKRDGQMCMLCNEMKKLVVHHKDDKGLLNEIPNNADNNLITLCRSCHNAVTNLRNNASRTLASRLINALGPGTTGQPKFS